MKLIVTLDDDIAKGIRGENDCEVEPREIVRSFQSTIAEAIANGIPVTDGDLIMFRTLMTEIANKGLPFEEVLLLIDCAQTDTIPQDEWISVSERLPEEYGNYLVLTSDRDIDVGTFNPRFEDSWSMCDANGFFWVVQSDIKITHWRPLPKRPKESEDK